MDLPLTKKVCQLDGNGFFMHLTTADLDQYANDGSYLMPAGCIDSDAPTLTDNQSAQWQPESQTWVYWVDYRGQTAYDTTSGTPIIVTEWGDLPSNLTLSPRPTEYHVWNTKKQAWQTDNILKKQQEDAQFQTAKTQKLKDLAQAAQEFVVSHTQTDIVPTFEQDTYPLQGAEAKAWALDNTVKTPVLDRIADERGVPRDVLKAAALRKTLVYEQLTAHVAGQRQAYQTQIEQAQNLADLDNIVMVFRLPENTESTS